MRAPALARAVAILGAVAIGAFLCRASPREVTLVYDVSAIPGATGLDVAAGDDDSAGVRLSIHPAPLHEDLPASNEDEADGVDSLLHGDRYF